MGAAVQRDHVVSIQGSGKLEVCIATGAVKRNAQACLLQFCTFRRANQEPGLGGVLYFAQPGAKAKAMRGIVKQGSGG